MNLFILIKKVGTYLNKRIYKPKNIYLNICSLLTTYKDYINIKNQLSSFYFINQGM